MTMMQWRDLTDEQIDVLESNLRPTMAYLNRLRERMFQKFCPDDQLFAEVTRARDAMHALCISLHYSKNHCRNQTMRGGIG